MSRNPKSEAREWVVQFLYQCESEKLYHYSESHLRDFVRHFQVPTPIVDVVRALARGTLDRVSELDERIQGASANWKLSRMPLVDRTILRLATHELLERETPPRVVMNEAIELAKKFGSDDSSRFVNGVLDRLAHTLTAEPA